MRTHSSQDATGVIADDGQNNALIAFGTSAPADGSKGYAVGALFIKINGADGSQWYRNDGTTSSADFNLITGGIDLAGLTATAAELNARAAAASRYVNVTDAATYAVLAADSGKIHIMPNFTADCTLTLPTAAAGLEYTFIGKGVAADAQSWIISTGSGTNFFLGGLGFADTDDPADTVAAVYPNGSSNDFCTVAAPGGGTRIHVICDGTNWIINGIVVGATAPAFSDT